MKTLFPLNERAMCRELVTTDFCISAATDLYLFPTSCLRVLVGSWQYPPRTSMMMLCCITLQSGCLCYNSERNGPYFLVFTIAFYSLFSTHGQLISSSLTSFLSLSIVLAWILLDLTWVVSANNGTSQYATTRSFSYIGFDWTWEYQGALVVMRSKDLSISKNKILRALLCLARYCVWANALQPANIWPTLSHVLPHVRQRSSAYPLMPVFSWW